MCPRILHVSPITDVSGWSYDDVLPYFKRSEASTLFNDEFHNSDGNIQIELPLNSSPLRELCFEAFEDLGVRRNPDYNGAAQEGSCFYPFTANHGRRVSAADSFLTPVKDRPNLAIVTGAHVTGVQFAGKRATGVSAFVRLREEGEYPSGQLVCVVFNTYRHRDVPPRLSFSGFLCRTFSKGSVRLATNCPFDRPVVDPNYLSDPSDLEQHVDLVRFQYRLAEHRVFDKVRAEILGPGKEREQIISEARANVSTTWYQTLSKFRYHGDDCMH